MLGFISKKKHDAEIETMTKARDGLVECLNSAERLNRELNQRLGKEFQLRLQLDEDFAALSDRAKRLEIDNQRLAKEAEDSARFVEVGKRRLASLEKDREAKKAKRRAVA